MAFALLIGSTILFFEARGFDLNRKTGEVIQNGLVFVDAHPEQATVFMNGKQEARTDSRITIPAGEYTFEFKRDGYRSWSRTFNLLGSQIERLNYIFMFPEQLETTEVRQYSSSPDFVTQSPDRKWLIVHQPGKLGTFDIYDLSNQNSPPVTTLALPAGLLNTTTDTNKLELVEWSTDSRRVLVKHTFRGGNEFLVIDRERPNESLNLNQHLDVPLYNVALRDKKFDKLHILDKNGGTLRFADTKSKQISKVADMVYSFKSYGDDVIFFTTSEGAKNGTVNANIKKGNKTFTVRNMPAADTYPIDITRFDNEWYLAVGNSKDNKAYLFHEVFKDLDRDAPIIPFPITIFAMKQLDNISVSANTRFISVQGGSEFAIYDAEHNRQYQYDTNLKFAKGQKAKWMDGHRLNAVIDGKHIVWDYDNINRQTLVGSQPAFVPFFDRDYDFLYALAPSSTKGQSALTKTPMRTEADL